MEVNCRVSSLSMGSESALSRTFRKNVKGKTVRIESPLTGKGIPDVLWLLRTGKVVWIELKYLDNWPARADTPIDLGLTINQALFLHNWVMDGGSAYILVQVDREYLLVHGSSALRIVKGLQKHDLYSILYCNWPRGIGWDELANIV